MRRSSSRTNMAVPAVAIAIGLAACSGGNSVQSPATSKASMSPTTTPSTATPSPAPSSSAGTFVADDWPVFGHDAARTGTSNEMTGVHGAVTLTKLWQIGLGDVADSAPVVKGGMLFVTTHNGTSYGIATSNGAKIWTFTTTGPNITTSEPAYDVAGGKVYVPGVDGKVHRLNPATGVEDTSGGFPVLVTLATQTEKDASPLNIANGYVYAQTSAYNGDGLPYVGHVVAINMSTGASHVFNTLCSSQTGLIQPSSCSENMSGMWSRAGVVVDPDSTMSGHVYVATGNGKYDPSNGNYGDSVLKLASDGSSLSDHFAPSNAAALDADDQDLGSTSPVLLPRQPTSSTPLMLVQGGKDAMLRLLDRSNLNGANALLQTIALTHGLYSAPAVYVNPSGQTFVYVGISSGVNAYEVATSGGVTQLTPVWADSISLGSAGTSPIVRDGVVYVAASNQLVALDAATGATLGSSSSLGGVHWESPIAANGIIYCTDQNSNLTAFGITVTPSGSAKGTRRGN